MREPRVSVSFRDACKIYTPPASVGGGRWRYVSGFDKRGGLRSERTPRAESPQAGTPKGKGPSTSKVSHLPTAAPALREGAWTFRSRPDLTPPVVEVTAQAHDTAPGYIFMAPENIGTNQGGPMIIDDRGEVVWFRPLRGGDGREHDLKVQSYRGRSVLTWMDGALNDYVIADHSYREIARFGAGNGRIGDHHEFLISPQDTTLIAIYNAVPRDLSSIGGLENDTVWQGIVQEFDIESGEVLAGPHPDQLNSYPTPRRIR